MKNPNWLLCGPLASLVLATGIGALPVFVPGYNPVRQTVSEIGEMGSPAQIPFSVMLLIVAALALLFAIAIYRISAQRGHQRLAAWFVGSLSIVSAGLALCPFPDPLHNVFGTSELIAYQTPIVLAWQWRNDPQAARLVKFCWVFSIVQWLSLIVNFLVFFRDSHLWQVVAPFYGLIQRSLFATLCCWLTGVGLMLRQLSVAGSSHTLSKAPQW
jgi:hypothetical membrane protein